MAKPVRSFTIHVALTLNFQKIMLRKTFLLNMFPACTLVLYYFSLKKSFLKTNDLPTQKQEIKLKADISKKY